jgi:hypothetical protein
MRRRNNRSNAKCDEANRYIGSDSIPKSYARSALKGCGDHCGKLFGLGASEKQGKCKS